MTRNKFIAEREKKYFRKISALQRAFKNLIINYFTKNLLISDGVISNSTKNISTSRFIKRLQKDFANEDGFKTVKFLVKDLTKLNGLNGDYFKSIPQVKNTKISHIEQIVLKKMMQKLGFDLKKNQVVDNSFLDDLVKMDSVYNRVKAEALRSVVNKVPLSKFRQRIDELVEDKGLIRRHFNTMSGDIYSQFERESSNQMRIGLKLQFAQYSGGTIGTTRDFCKERNNKIFHISEIENFGTDEDAFGGYSSKPDFQGKTDPYDPISDLGGYNCRHTLDWISDRMAVRRRPDAAQFLN